MSFIAIEVDQNRDQGRTDLDLVRFDCSSKPLEKKDKEMNKTTIYAALAVTMITQSAPQSAIGAGYQTTRIAAPHREKGLELHIWYPDQGDGERQKLGKNAVFVGVDVNINANPQGDSFPVVLLSHGSGGNAVNLSWIAAHLADEGMMVVATNHPGTTSRDSLPSETIKIWERPADMSVILDYLQTAPSAGLKPDMARVAAVGFSLGGYSVLGLAGAKTSKNKFFDYCDQYSSMWDCKWLVSTGMDLKKSVQMKFDQSNLDARVKTVVAIDPALAQAYDMESLEEIKLPTLVVNLGVDEEVPLAINGKLIAGSLAYSTYRTIKGATHFSFLGECTFMGKTIIVASGEDPICSEVSERKRRDIHEELKGVIGEFLRENL